MKKNLTALCIANITKAELLLEGIFFLIHLFAGDVLVMKKLEIEKTKPTFIISVLKVENSVLLVSLISSFFINKMSLANKWMRKKIPSLCYSALIYLLNLQRILDHQDKNSTLVAKNEKSAYKTLCVETKQLEVNNEDYELRMYLKNIRNEILF